MVVISHKDLDKGLSYWSTCEENQIYLLIQYIVHHRTTSNFESAFATFKSKGNVTVYVAIIAMKKIKLKKTNKLKINRVDCIVRADSSINILMLLFML